MDELQEAGHVQHIGVRNFSVRQLHEAEAVSDTPIVTNQVEYHPFTDQSQLLEHYVDNGVILTANSPLAVGRKLENETLIRIGERYGKSPAQVALCWLIQRENTSTIPKASKLKHQEEKIDIFDFELTTAEIDAIFNL
ncbi:hypothetical protein DEQ92_19065 [Haloferax sp. Atlit-6N]|nr:hypothetical protein DEQ92_19065 [Haloferax sp. Atlit-6N]